MPVLAVIHQRRLKVAEEAGDREHHAPNVRLRDGDPPVENLILLSATEGTFDVDALACDGRGVHHLVRVIKLLAAACLRWDCQIVHLVGEGAVHHEAFVCTGEAFFVDFVEEPTELRNGWVRDPPRVGVAGECEGAAAADGAKEFRCRSLFVFAPYRARNRLVAWPLDLFLVTVDEGFEV